MLKIQNGDFIFSGGVTNFSTAINQVTQTKLRSNYSHIGIVERTYNRVAVLHASPNKGVCKEALLSYLAEANKNKEHSSLFRLKPTFQPHIKNALRVANNLVGAPYNASFRKGELGFYCSEYIQQIFEAATIFELAPMTFKDPETGEFLASWCRYYKKLGQRIPEGELGCNPNQMAMNPALVHVGELN